MQKIRTILFATSLSDFSRPYFAFTAMLTHQLRAKIVILHVIEALQENYEGIAVAFFGEEKWRELIYDYLQRRQKAGLEDDGEVGIIYTAMQEFYREALVDKSDGCDLNHRLVIQGGEVADVILNEAEKNSCDLIIMGTSKGYLSGVSTSPYIKTVIKKSQVPVIVVPPPFKP